jgi:site-specific recombinase XerD
LEDVVTAKAQRLPVVFIDEVDAVLSRVTGTPGLILQLIYGTGMRVLKCLRLRVNDLNFEAGELVIREANGAKDRVTMLPASLAAPLQVHLQRVRLLHAADWRDGFGEVYLPNALARKYPQAGSSKFATHHTLRHSFATHLLQSGYDIHSDHPWSSRAHAVRSIQLSC